MMCFASIDPSQPDVTDAFQAEIDANIGQAGGRRIDLADGIYQISRPLRIAPGQDFDAKLHIRGSGRRGVTIRQKDDNANIFEFVNSTQNLRGIVLEDLCLNRGANAIRMERCAYNMFRNISFFQTGGSGTDTVLLQNGSNSNTFDNCWWVHTAGDSLRINGSGSALLTGCTIGEDAGNLFTSDTLTVVGCKLHGAPFDKVKPNGHSDMGKSTFTVAGFGSLSVIGCTGNTGPNFVNIDQVRKLVIQGNQLTCGDDSIINVRRVDRKFPVNISGNSFRLPDTCQIVRSVIGRRPSNWLIANNTFEAAIDPCPTLPDWFLDPQYGNIAGPNVHAGGIV